MSSKIVMHRAMAPALVAHLNRLVPLPTEGLLAGQALCSAVLDVYGDGGGVYNDIDVFLNASEDQLRALEASREQERLMLTMSGQEADDYEGTCLFERDSVYLAGSTREGLLNRIWCRSDVGESLSPTALLMSFDLNCVEVALDLASGKLYWTEAFQYFLRTRQLELTSLATAPRTLLRYFKKRRELTGIYGDDQFNVEMVAALAAAHSSDPTPTFPDEVPELTPELAQQWEAYPLLSAWFACSEPNEHGSCSVTLRQRPPDDRVRAMAQYRQDSNLTQLPQRVYRSRRALSAKFTRQRDPLIRMMAPFLFVRGCFEDFGPAYLKGNHSPAHVTEVGKLVERHSDLGAVLYGLTLDQQYQAALAIRHKAKLEGPWVYGLVETRAVSLDLAQPAFLADFFEREGGYLDEQLVIPLVPPQSYKGWVIRELVTYSALQQEGEALHHCVGGHAHAVRAGQSRVFSFRKGSDPSRWSTAEVNGVLLQREGRLKVKQHRGSRNERPHRDNQRAERLFFSWLARQHGWDYQPKSAREREEDDRWLLL